MNQSFEILLKGSLDKVNYAIWRHENGQAGPLSVHVLARVKRELEEMIKVMNPKNYAPTYPRYILDWPDEDGLIKELIDVAYLYQKIR